MPSRRSPIPYISATTVRACRIGLGHLERFQGRRGHAFVGLEAAPRGLLQGRVAGRLEVELDLGQLLDPVAGLLAPPVRPRPRPARRWACGAQVGGDLLLARHLLADEEQQALAQQVDLAGEVVGERAERDAGGAGDAAVGDGGDSLATDQLDRGAKDALAGVGGARRWPRSASLPVSPIVRSNEQASAREEDDVDQQRGDGRRRSREQCRRSLQRRLACRSRRAAARPARPPRASWSRRRWSEPRRRSRALNAFRVICAEEALAEADEADRRLGDGDGAPLLGVPVAIKDDVHLTGHTTPFGCGGGRPAVRDAEAVRRLREAGAIVIGKTHAPEVGLWHFTETPLHGATRNPWNTDHTPGGSSGGAAAAVAAGVVPAAIGSDGAGSIRIPAAWTGLVGLKPQRGRVSTWPDPEAFNGLSCYGPLARSAADAALLLDAIHGNVPADLHKPKPPSEPFCRGCRP